MNKNAFAESPPMGWNSYDYYDTSVNEDQVKANADYMAGHLKEYGWEYIVIDNQWYAYGAGSRREEYQYIPFGRYAMDEYSRLLPCPERFPSSTGGKGFGPLADYIHSLGLKFGIHIMRGIPRIAAHTHSKISGTADTADMIADPASICKWNPDMYGLRAVESAQKYYDSIIDLYAGWGIDYIKCDDICNMNLYRPEERNGKVEIEMLYRAIQKCGRPIVLSLSPGPAHIEDAWHYEKYANMWRITDDLWDDWALVKNMFARCEVWQNHVSQGCYPDCDMLPFGYLGKGFGEERRTRLTKAEQKTVMTLWCIFRSPLMIGAELTKLDDWTLSLLTNPEVLDLLCETHESKQICRDDRHAAWYSIDRKTGKSCIALFNLCDEIARVGISLKEAELEAAGIVMKSSNGTVTELWSGQEEKIEDGKLSAEIEPHGVRLYKL